MPLVRIDLSSDITPPERGAIGDAVHAALVDVVGIPPDDRFQLVTARDAGSASIDPSYLGVERSARFVIVQIFLRGGRPVEMKQRLYAGIAARIARATSVRPEDVMIVLTENGVEDWSFGNGVAQYVEARTATAAATQ